MKVSHESPLSILSLSRKYNDYDYALVHLFDEYKNYLNFFKDSLKMKRTVYLDNSIFELGKAFDSNEFAKYCDELYQCVKDTKHIKNFHFIVPDVLEDFEGTKKSFLEFESKYKDCDFYKASKIGVVQGKTFNELIQCFYFMKFKCDVVAISFDYSYFGHTPKEWMEGRIKFIHWLNDNGLLKGTKIHLLGCGLPQEFNAYKGIKEIVSVDTSNPVVHGIKGIRYSKDGLNHKESQKLVELIEYPVKDELKDILFNVLMFKSFVRDLWVPFYSQSGSEILSLIEKGFLPDFIVSDTMNNSVKFDCLVLDYRDFEFYRPVLEQAKITLHGFLKIIPKERILNMVNGHPGLITRFPQLKGKDPQQKAFELGLKESGCVLHQVTEELDSGPVLDEIAVVIDGLSLDEVYKKLKEASLKLWVKFLCKD